MQSNTDCFTDDFCPISETKLNGLADVTGVRRYTPESTQTDVSMKDESPATFDTKSWEAHEKDDSSDHNTTRPTVTQSRITSYLKIEPILDPTHARFILHPIRYNEVWSMYKEAEASYWTAEDIDFSRDTDDWNNKLNEDERDFLSRILSLFAAADDLVDENILGQLSFEVQMPEARCFYSFHTTMKNIHSEAYSIVIMSLIRDRHARIALFRGIQDLPFLKAKADWSRKWIHNQLNPFASRLVASAAATGIFFSSSFASIYWFRVKGVMPGLCFSNELISRDERLHTRFACLLFQHLQIRPETQIVHEIIEEAVGIEQALAQDWTPRSLPGLDGKLMAQYIEFVADDLLSMLHYPPLYLSSNPFTFTDSTSTVEKSNSFDKRMAEYHIPDTNHRHTYTTETSNSSYTLTSSTTTDTF